MEWKTRASAPEKSLEVNQSPPTIQKSTRLAVTAVWLAPLLIMASLIMACNQISNQVFKEKISAGEITYQISFPDITDDNITASLLPDRMSYTFTPDGFTSHFESAGGVFRNRIVADHTQRTLLHQLKVFRKKVEVRMDESDVLKRLAQYPKSYIVETPVRDTIAGYPCKKALIVFEDVDRREIEVYYTDAIDTKTPNWCTQYHDINGVLLAYEVEEFGIRMQLRAESITPTQPAEDVLQPDPDYDLITEEIMDIEVAQLKATFEL